MSTAKERDLTVPLIVGSTLLRIGFFVFGLYQDAHMDVKYTDIDYLVFSDAAKYVYEGGSPYQRETYRYTPLLAWFLIPNAADERTYSFGKILFVVSDLITGVLILKILNLVKISQLKKTILASIWLLNPMVITISTRGSSESVLAVFIMTFVYFLIKRRVIISGLFAGLAIHFKIYPIIYIPTAVIYLSGPNGTNQNISTYISSMINKRSILFVLSSAISFISLGALMYEVYGDEFLQHSYIYHLSRLDHRHNFSVYNISLYFSSALQATELQVPRLDFTKLAFVPQLVISGIILPLVFTKKSFTSTLFLQTLTFVTYNKVMTSQYFIWFLIFLPFFLRNSKLPGENKITGIVCLLLWVVSQASWLLFAYKLEFLGENTFFPGLLFSSGFFFLSNIYILGEFVHDLSNQIVSDGI